MTEQVMLIGRRMPEFVAEAVIDGEITTVNSLEYLGSYTLLFFYPADFSIVCPTELHALQERMGEFKARNTRVITVSTDSVYAHQAWRKVPRDEGGILGTNLSMISDIRKKISRAFNVYDEKSGDCLRGVFLMDKEGKIQYGAIDNYWVGRSIDEVLRMVDAIQYTMKHIELCPANWKPGKPTMKPNEISKLSFYQRFA